MSIEPDREQIFQYGTFAVIGTTLVVCLCLGLIFINPNANPIAALRPVSPTMNVAAIMLPATWTPTATSTSTLTPTSTNTPTRTLVPSNTPLPSSTATRIPTQRPRPAATSTPRPATAVPPDAHFSLIKRASTHNCKDDWSISGTVWANGYGNGFVTGTRVQIWLDNGQVFGPVAAGTGDFTAVSPGYYEFTFKRNSRRVGSIGIVDSNGNLLSPKYDVGLTSHCGAAADINQLTVDFSRDH